MLPPAGVATKSTRCIVVGGIMALSYGVSLLLEQSSSMGGGNKLKGIWCVGFGNGETRLLLTGSDLCSSAGCARRCSSLRLAFRTWRPIDSSPIPRSLQIIQVLQSAAALAQPMSPTTAGPPGGAVQLAAGDADSEQPPLPTVTPDDDETPPARAPPSTIRVGTFNSGIEQGMLQQKPFEQNRKDVAAGDADSEPPPLPTATLVDDQTQPARAPPVPATDGAAPPIHDFQPARGGNRNQKQMCS